MLCGKNEPEHKLISKLKGDFMENLEPYLDKFSESGRRVLEGAFDESRRRDQNFISPEHILYALMGEETNLFDATMRHLSIDPQDFRLAVEKRLENSRRHEGIGFRIAPETTDIFKHSMDRARSLGRRIIDASDICFILAANKLGLLNDILQNPEAPVPVFHTNRIIIGMQEQQSYFLSRLQIKPSDFLTRFSLKELVKNNTSPSASLCAKDTGGFGGWLNGGSSEQTTNNKHETFHCLIEPEDFAKFDEKEFISSLSKDVEDGINQSGLKITEANSPNSSSFHVKYESLEIKGQIDIFGAMRNGYYELQAMAVEKSNRKTK